MRGRISSAATADEILARGAVIHKLPPPGWGRLLRSLMHNCETDISGDCPFMPSSVAGGVTGAKRCVMPYSARSRLRAWGWRLRAELRDTQSLRFNSFGHEYRGFLLDSRPYRGGAPSGRKKTAIWHRPRNLSRRRTFGELSRVSLRRRKRGRSNGSLRVNDDF